MTTWNLIVDNTATPAAVGTTRSGAVAALIDAARTVLTDPATGAVRVQLVIDGAPVAAVRMQPGPDGTPARASALENLDRIAAGLAGDALAAETRKAGTDV